MSDQARRVYENAFICRKSVMEMIEQTRLLEAFSPETVTHALIEAAVLINAKRSPFGGRHVKDLHAIAGLLAAAVSKGGMSDEALADPVLLQACNDQFARDGVKGTIERMLGKEHKA